MRWRRSKMGCTLTTWPRALHCSTPWPTCWSTAPLPLAVGSPRRTTKQVPIRARCASSCSRTSFGPAARLSPMTPLSSSRPLLLFARSSRPLMARSASPASHLIVHLIHWRPLFRDRARVDWQFKQRAPCSSRQGLFYVSRPRTHLRSGRHSLSLRTCGAAHRRRLRRPRHPQ